MSWLPQISWSDSMLSDSDDLSEDAQGWAIWIEWRGHIFEFTYLRRGAVTLD